MCWLCCPPHTPIREERRTAAAWLERHGGSGTTTTRSFGLNVRNGEEE